MSFLLDTNVVSEMRKGSAQDHGVSAWLALVDEGQLYVSVLVVGEIRRGVEMLRKRDATRAAAYEAWLGSLTGRFENRILLIDDAVADAWGHVSAVRSLPIVDALLAATAIVHDLVLVTRNEKDVRGTGVRTLNPFAR